METLDTVNREGRERLHPFLTNPSCLVLRKRREIFQKWLARLDDRELAVLDLGDGFSLIAQCSKGISAAPWLSICSSGLW
jgi:hypothetical protein